MSDDVVEIAAHVYKRVLSEIDATRTKYVEDQVSRQLDHREGDMSRAQIDDAEIAARLGWDARHPALARLHHRGAGGAA